MAKTAPPDIQVYASFPRVVVLGPDLNVDPSNWRWVHCLTLPIETFNALQFSQRPYKWIRYTIGVIVGAEGDLSTSPDSPDVVNYNAGLPAKSTVLYYHTSDDEGRRMFPVDPNIGRTNVTSSCATTQRAEFNEEVANRDGRTCALTGIEAMYCDAVHLLAHSKGDTVCYSYSQSVLTHHLQYITTYTQRRSRDRTGGDIVQDIDNIRNGLFLNRFTHTALGKNIAFLMVCATGVICTSESDGADEQTPNFAMNTADIDPTAPPAKRKCTAHRFRLNDPVSFGGLGAPPSGSPLRLSDTPECPPPILFDAVYAGAVLHHFGTQILKDEVVATWKETFYPSGVMTTAHADYKVITDERAATMERTQNQTHDRKARYEARGSPDTFDMLMTLPYIMVPRNELQAMLRGDGEGDGAETRA
jgi:hypothetical protein